MLDILLVVHAVIALLLIAVILMQKNSGDGLAGLGSSGGGNNMGVVTARTAANFMTKTTVVLATAFIINSLILANLSNKSGKHSRVKDVQIQEKIEGKSNHTNPSDVTEATSAPIAE
ncbi:MAG: preprotein translocase subunit SecG [Pseudomonadota bacterium]|jgi:preprotein translocase subunit SecG